MNPEIKPDVILSVRFYTPAEGGRQTGVGGPEGPGYYGCPLFIGGEAGPAQPSRRAAWPPLWPRRKKKLPKPVGQGWECRLLLGDRRLELGRTYEVPAKFMSPGLVLPLLAVGREFRLWEGKFVGEGAVLEILGRPGDPGQS